MYVCVCVCQGTSSRTGAVKFKQILGLPEGQSQNLKGRFRATPEKSQDPEEPGPRTPALNLNRISGPHENVDGALHCLYACAWHMCTCESLHGAMCTVYTAAQTQVCVCDCMCTIVCLKVFELCCMCRRGLTRRLYVRCACLPMRTRLHMCMCVCVRACLLMKT